MLSASGFVDDVIFVIPWDNWTRIKHDVIFRRSSPGDGTKWSSYNYGVWWSSSERGTAGSAVCYLRLPCFCLLSLRRDKPTKLHGSRSHASAGASASARARVRAAWKFHQAASDGVGGGVLLSNMHDDERWWRRRLMNTAKRRARGKYSQGRPTGRPAARPGALL